MTQFGRVRFIDTLMYACSTQGSTIMRTVHLIVKRTLFGLVGIMVVAAICFSSTMPSSLRLVEEMDGTRVFVAKPVSAHSVATTHVRRTQAAKGLQPKSSGAKTIESKDRKVPKQLTRWPDAKISLPRTKHQPFAGKRIVQEKLTIPRRKAYAMHKILVRAEHG